MRNSKEVKVKGAICFAFFIVISIVCLSAGSARATTRGIRVTALDKSSGMKKEVKLYHKSYAVIIGIDQYKNLKFDQQLSYAVGDAKGVEKALRKNFKFDKIITLYNRDATKENIMKVLSGDLSKLSKDDSVFVFWAGHGYTEKTDFGNLGYLLPFDGNFEESELYRNISMTMIRDDVSKRIPAKHIFFVMDSCYSGLLVSKRGVSRKYDRDFAYLKEITKEQVRQVLTAGSKDQQVLDGGPKGHSVFTGRFIEALENTEDFITATEISSLISEKVYSDARARNFTQKPDFGKLFGVGDYVFVPSLEQKVEDTKSKVTSLQKEFERLETLEKAASKAKDDRAKRMVKFEKRAIQAKLKAEQLRQQALEENRKKIEQEEEERLRSKRELAEMKKAENIRLAILTQDVKKKRKALGGVTLSSLSPKYTISEMRGIDSKIKKIRADFQKELANSKKQIFARFEKTFEELRHQKQDEFETEEEFRSSIAERKNKAAKEERSEVVSLENKIENEYNKQVDPFIKTLKKLSQSEFTLTGGSLALEVGRYNPTSNAFPVTIRAKHSIKGITVAANADIKIPRQEARTFKQHFTNNILRPEISGHFDNINNFNETKAYVIDDANSRQFDLFSRNKYKYDVKKYAFSLGGGVSQDGKFIVYESGVVYDTSVGLEWFAGPDRDTRWDSAKSWVENLSAEGHEWRMPAMSELQSLYKRNAGTRNMTPLIKTTGRYVWSSEHDSSRARAFFFDNNDGDDDWYSRNDSYKARSFAVRSHK